MLEELARKARRHGHTDAIRPYIFRIAQQNEPATEDSNLIPAVERQREQAFLLSRPKTNGNLTAEIDGVSHELQRHGHRKLLHMDVQNSDRVTGTLVNADDQELMEQENMREEQYPA